MRLIPILLFLTSVETAGAQTVPVFGAASAPGTVIASPPAGGVTSPVLREDELEIVYESLGNIWRGTRPATTVPFEQTAPIAELSTTEFAEERPFLTPDALGIYFTRFKATPVPTRKFFYARRPSLAQPFQAPVEVGIEGVSFFQGSLGSVSSDELTLYLEIVRESSPGSGLPQHTDIACATRSSTSGKFGMWKFLTQLNSSNLEKGPSTTRDGRSLYYSVQGVGSPGFLFVSLRPDRFSPFGTGNFLQGVNAAGVANRDPFLVFPGNRLYYVRNDVLVFSNRILSAEYRIGDAVGMPGRRTLLPVSVSTSESDAVHFEAPVFFNPNLLTLRGVRPASGIGVERLEVSEISQGRYRVLFTAKEPLQGIGEHEMVFDLDFIVADNAPLGQISVSSGGTYRVNKVGVPSPAPGRITLVDGPNYPASSMIRLR